LRYLNGTISPGLLYRRSTHDKIAIEEFEEAYYAKNVNRKLLSQYVFTLFELQFAGNPIYNHYLLPR